jgi:hypothetical protein
MTRSHLLMIAMTVVAGAIPGIAQASCSGNACSAVSAVATWSASDKRVNAVLTNKDQAKEMRLKFCITVEGSCNSFELTLPPHGNATKSVSLSMRLGSAAPPKIAVDVSSADFTVAQGSSQAPAAAASSAAVTAVDVPGLGKFTYPTAAESAVGSSLKKAISSFATAENLNAELQRQDDKLASITRTLQSIPDIEADVARNNRKSKADSISARNADTGFELAATMLDYLQNEAKGAVANLAISKDDLTAVQDKNRADELMVEAEKSRQGLLLLLSVIPTATEAAKKVASGPEGQASLALAAVNKVIETFAANPWADEAKKLQAEAARLQASGAAQKLKLAGDHLKSAQETVARLQPILQRAMATHDEAWKLAKQSYDDATKGPFQWKILDAAIPDAQKIIELARKTTEAAYGAREAAKALDQTGAGGNWATPGENHRIAMQMVDKSRTIFEQSARTRQEVENLLKNLETASAKAKGAL